MEKRFALGVSVFFGQTLSVFPLFSMLGLLLIPAPLVGTMSSDRLKQCLSEVSIAIENDKWAAISTEPDWHEEVNRWVDVEIVLRHTGDGFLSYLFASSLKCIPNSLVSVILSCHINCLFSNFELYFYTSNERFSNDLYNI